MGKIHLGVYGICISQNKILLIKKGRGPYTGLHDLPGGKIEFGESMQDALTREVLEETGAKVISSYFLCNKEYITSYKNNKEERQVFHHVGIYYNIAISYENIKTDSDGEDTAGALFIDIDNLAQLKLSPIAELAIKEYWAQKKQI